MNKQFLSKQTKTFMYLNTFGEILEYQLKEKSEKFQKGKST